MKTRCIKTIHICGITFREGEEYDFDEQEFTETYSPAIHPVAPARGRRIRYMRYKIKRVLRWACNPDDKTEMKDIYFYDYAYCMHHNYRDERGHATECFDDYFAAIRQRRDKPEQLPKNQIWPRENPLLLECPEHIKEKMRCGYPDWLRQMLGGTEYKD